MSTRYDAIVIRTGQSGPSLASALPGGLKIAVIERQHFGGTCANTGCVPTTALVASAHSVHMARRAADSVKKNLAPPCDNPLSAATRPLRASMTEQQMLSLMPMPLFLGVKKLAKRRVMC